MEHLPELAAKLRAYNSAADGDDDIGDLVVAISAAAKSEHLHYVFLLCLSYLRSADNEAAEQYRASLSKATVVDTLVANHRLIEAVHLASAQGFDAKAEPLTLPMRQWNIAGTDRWLTIEEVVRSLCELAGVQEPRVSGDALQRTVAAQLRRWNARMKDAVLMQLMRHAGALNGMQWRRLTKQSRHQVVHMRLHFASAMLTVSLRAKGLTARKTTVLPFRFASGLSEAERAEVDSHFATRVLSKQVFAIVMSLMRRTNDAQTLLQDAYDLLLRPVLSRRNVARTLAALEAERGKLTLVVSTHGALAQLPFAALHDGNGWLGERFDIVQAPPLYSADAFARGDMDYEAMTGGDAALSQPGISVLADTGLPGARREAEIYRARAAAGAKIIVRDAQSDPHWDKDIYRWLLDGAGIAILSCHMRASAQRAGASAFVTPDGRNIAVSEIIDAPISKDMVVLAACDSLSKTDWFGSQEDSVASRLRRAGAAAVVATLWPVSDEAARLYNVALTEALLAGVGRAAAHGHAQKVVRCAKVDVFSGHAEARAMSARPAPWAADGFTHPFYWAPFVLSGAWR